MRLKHKLVMTQEIILVTSYIVFVNYTSFASYYEKKV
jgi:hypothetical protein